MTTMYAPTDVRSINLADQGCGSAHEAGDLGEGERWQLDCVMCCLALAGMPAFGWANHPSQVKPTCDEIAQYERDEKEANRVGTAALAQMRLTAMNTMPPGAAEQFAAQLAAMQAQNEALAKQVADLIAAQSAKTAAPAESPAIESADGALVKPTKTTARKPKAATE